LTFRFNRAEQMVFIIIILLLFQVLAILHRIRCLAGLFPAVSGSVFTTEWSRLLPVSNRS